MSFLDATGRAFCDWMGPMLFQSALLVAIVGAVDFAIRKRAWPEVRIALWGLALAKLVLPPWLFSPVSVTRPFAAAVGPNPYASAKPDAAGGPSLETLLFLAWLAIGAALAVAAVARARRSRERLLAGAVPPCAAARAAFREAARLLGLRTSRLPRLVASGALRSPALVGLFRPVVVLPIDAAETLSTDELTHVFLHELAHVRRRDLAFDAAALALQVVYWFHPLVLLARRRVHALREMCCDAAVADALGPATREYRRTLLECAARGYSVAPAPPGALGMFTGSTGLFARLDQLERESWRHARRRKAAWALVVAAGAACVLPMAGADAGAEGAGSCDARDPRVERELLSARAVVDAAIAGERDGCLRLRYAVMRLNDARPNGPSGESK